MLRPSAVLISLCLSILPVGGGRAEAVRADQVLTLGGSLKRSDAAYTMSSFHYVPFRVPEGVTGITIEHDYRAHPSGTFGLNTNIFDARGHGHGTEGFRGRHTSLHLPIAITEQPATTSRAFTPGPIRQGVWYIGQHFMWVSKDVQSVTYRYTITLTFGRDARGRQAGEIGYRPGVINPARGWYRCDFHSHTNHSDGTGPLTEMVANHVAAGYDAITVTDHSVVGAHFEMPEVGQRYPDRLLLAGEEVSSVTGEFLAIGTRPGTWFDPRSSPGDGRLPDVIRKVHRDGGIVCLAHPGSGGVLAWRFPLEEWAHVDAVEVWNSAWGPSDAASEALWEEQLESGRRITALGGSDYHNPDNPFLPFTWVWCRELSREAVLDSVRRGHVFISRSATGPQAYLTSAESGAIPGDTVDIAGETSLKIQVRVVNAQGCSLQLLWPHGETKLPVTRDFQTFICRVPVPAGRERSYVRARVLSSNGPPEAITNPIYILRSPRADPALRVTGRLLSTLSGRSSCCAK